MKDLTEGQILLMQLTPANAVDFYKLYTLPDLTANYGGSPFLPGETPEAFTARIISVCEFIWTIRLVHNPGKIIGDCALHHWNPAKKEIEIGGSLLPAFRGKGFMKAAFLLAEEVARNETDAKALLTKTQTSNLSAITMAKNAGFTIKSANSVETVLRKTL